MTRIIDAGRRTEEVLNGVLKNVPITREMALELSRLQGADLWDLFAAANRIRQHFRGDRIDLCSIINARSGACSEDCAFCAQSAHHRTGAPVYPLVPVELMVEAAEGAKRNGARRFCIVTSGRGIDDKRDLEEIAGGVRSVKELGLMPCATLGSLDREQLKTLRDAGLTRYHHNIETSREYFPMVCTTHSFDERLELIRHARDLGLSTCSGGILGLGETVEDRVSMAMTLRELDVDSVPINLLMPIPGTPLQHVAPLEPLEALRAIALFRFILPQKEIRICGGRASLGVLHPFIFLAGADGFLVGNYLTTTGLDPEADLRMLRDLGLARA